ncbi:ABC transporter permease [Panacibacter sp. DH6]|uniref:ABC transporter permease n=1 Tax=Panacibacter microcysteis TaxID=2793269 RepID=A0A931GV94_9BACT|nr:ABC transporter permease [Panacibacter microcysteis]MBG9377561.1 ABC transporter permease [Panacibacter microcysteis]
MFKNYLNIAFRNLARHKVYSLINIAGLSIGLACSMLIILYVKDEVSYDQFHSNVNHIYRIVSRNERNGEERYNSNTGHLQGPRFKQNVPGLETFVRVQSGMEDVKLGNEIQSQSLLFVDSSFFSVFSFPLVEGNPKTCLTEPHSIVLSEDEAKKQFGNTSALGKTVMVKEDSTFVPYKVTAVSERCPQNSSIKFDVLLPFRSNEADAANNDNWYSYFLNTFVTVNPGSNVEAVEKQIQKFYIKDASATFTALNLKYGGPPDAKMETYFLQPFTDMHLNTQLPAQNGLSNQSNPVYSYILSGIALFILLIACINFVNLTVARSVKRAKEIGIRKVVGGDRRQLITQFLGESFVLCFLAFVMAIVLAIIVLPVFNDLANKKLAFSYLADARLVVGYIALFAVTSLLAGFYPALVLSGYKPVETLYSKFTLRGKNYLQKSLVVLQFALASFLIIATFTVYSQFDFLTHTDLGYDNTNIVKLQVNNLSHQKAALFKSELLKNANIVDAAAKNGGSWFTGAKIANDSSIQFAYETIDEHYLPMLKIPIVQGRNFSKDYPSDSISSILVNEAFVKKAGWKNPIGETVNFFYNNNEIYRVIGVVKDYHYAALNDTKIEPQVFTMKNSNDYGQVEVKIKPHTATEALKFLQSTFRQFFPMSPYQYVFKDEEYLKSYEAEEKWKQIILFGAVLTIFISCIGLFGLSVLSAEKRTKEIGIRKVLGASVQSIVTALSKDFLILVLIALIIAVPFAWIATNKWLEKYPYRISLSWELFAASGLMVICVALFTISFQSVKAAMSNPVKSLRTE